MQNSGQYGVSDAPQYVVGRQAAPPHIFSISHDNMSLAAPAAHALHAQQQQQQQQQQHHLPHHLQASHHHHYGPHPGHQPHSTLQQIHAPHSQHPQFPLPQHPPQAQTQQAQAQQSTQDVQQQHQQQQAHHQQQQAQQQQQQAREKREREQREQEHQLAQQQAAAQQAMVQQLGLGGPDSPEVPSPGVRRSSPTSQQYTSQTPQQQQQQQQQQQLVVVSAQEDDGLEEEGRSAGGNRWPRQETLALIKIRSEMDANFRDSGLKGPLWEEVSRKLAEQGYSRTAKKCKEKFENVHKYYKKTKDGKAGRQDGKSYRFFAQLEALYSGQEASLQLGSRLAASAAATLLSDTAAAASLLTGSAERGGKGEEFNALQQATTAAAAQQQREVSTGVTLSESMSDDDDYDEPESTQGGVDQSLRKRKRAGKAAGAGSKADFFSALMKSLMEKQESMQQTFLEFMERREQDRQARDEAWRRQELARVAREHELRVQEQQLAATRDAALVAFLQKVTGQTLTLPQIPSPRPIVSPPPVADSTPPPPHKAHHNLPTPSSQQLATVADLDPDRDSPVDPNSKRWPKPEVLTLIKLRSDMEPRFQEPGPKAPLWEEISQGMACLGYNRNQKRCKEKWENINKYFRKTKESNKKRPENAKTCPYFHQLELLYMKGVLGTPHNKQLVAKVAAASNSEEEKVDHQAVPLAQRTEPTTTTTTTTTTPAAPGADAEMLLKMLPAAADAVQNAAANSGNGSSGPNAGHLFSSPENGSSADPKASETST